jgi:hypothetical protein
MAKESTVTPLDLFDDEQLLAIRSNASHLATDYGHVPELAELFTALGLAVDKLRVAINAHESGKAAFAMPDSLKPKKTKRLRAE